MASLQSQQRGGDTGRIIPIFGGHIHVLDIPAKSPRPALTDSIVLLHGLGGSTRDMTFSLARELSPSARLIILDRPGHGKTSTQFDGPSDAPSPQADLILAALTAAGVTRFHLFGHSYGALMAAEMAIQEPSRINTLTLASGPFAPGIGPAKKFESVAMCEIGAHLAATSLALLPDLVIKKHISALFHPAKVPPGYFDHLQPREFLTLGHIRSGLNQVSALNAHLTLLKKRMGSITCPVTLIHGEQDHILDCKTHVSAAEEPLSDVESVTIPRAGHMIQHTHAPLVASKILTMALASEKTAA